METTSAPRPTDVHRKPMLLAEARYWPMNGRIASFDALANVKNHLRLRGSPIVARRMRHPFDHYDARERDILHLELSRVGELRLTNDVPAGLTLSRLFLRFWDIGIFTTYAVFAAERDLTPPEIDAKSAAAVGVVDELQLDLDGLVQTLGEQGVLRLGRDHRFGVPAVLNTINAHSASASYRYSNYVFYGSRPSLAAALAFYEIDARADVVTVDGVRVYLRWAHYLWDTCDESVEHTTTSLERRLMTDYLAMSEGLVYDNATECNRGFLDAILDRRSRRIEVDSSIIRETTLVHHRLLLEIRLWRALLHQHEQNLLDRVAAPLKLDAGARNFETSDSVVRYAVDSLDVREQHDADRLLAIALGVFTALTTFSAAADLYSLLKDDGLIGLPSVLTTLVQAGPFSLRTVLLAMATAGAVVALLFLAGDRAVRRRLRSAGASFIDRFRA